MSIKNAYVLFTLSFFVFFILKERSALAVINDSAAKSFLAEVIKAHGGKKNFYRLRDLQFRLIVKNVNSGKKDESIEQYLFDKERSKGIYLSRNFSVFPKIKGSLEQRYNGTRSEVYVNGIQMKASKLDDQSRYLRKRNYYLMAFPFKLLDDGVKAKIIGKRMFKRKLYTIVDLRSEKNRSRIFVNEYTKLIDRLAFTQNEGNVRCLPCVMKIEYQTIHGLKLPSLRIYGDGTWEGDLVGHILIREEISELQFWNGFTPKDFSLR